MVILDLQWEWEGSGKERKHVKLRKRLRWLIYYYYRGAIGVFWEQIGAIGVEMLLHTQESPTSVGLNASDTLHRP